MNIAGNAGVVDQDVDWTEGGGGTFEERIDRRLLTHLTLAGPGATTSGGNAINDLLGEIESITKGHGDCRAAFGKHFGNGASDSTGTTGNDGHAAGKILLLHARRS
jgi:hypothetical protein